MKHDHDIYGLEYVSHELRRALGVIVDTAANLRDGLDGPLSASQSLRVTTIVRAALDAASLLERARDPSAGDEGFGPALDPLPLGEATALVVERYAQVASRRSVSIRAALDDVRVPCDPILLEAAVGNLLANAVRMSPSGESVSVELREEPREGRAVLSVRDRGPGIAAADRGRIFDRGVRLDADPDGQGLGLAVCRLALRALGASVRVEENPGGGAAFVLSLPLRDARGETRSDARGPTIRPAPEGVRS
jgi:signal transduction histidine kinase